MVTRGVAEASTYFAILDIVPLRVDDPGLHVGHELANRSLEAKPFINGLCVCSGTRLRKAIALLYANPETLPDGKNKFLAERGSSRVEPTKRREIVLVDDGVLPKSQHNRRRDVEEGDVVLLNGLARLFNVPPWHDVAFGTRQEGNGNDDRQAL